MLVGKFIHIIYSEHVIGCIAIEFQHFVTLLFVSIIAITLVEIAICIVSMRGSILDTSPRASMQYWLYLRLSKDYNILNSILYLMLLFPTNSFYVNKYWSTSHWASMDEGVLHNMPSNTAKRDCSE